MFDSVRKITAWAWIILYVTLTSFSNGVDFKLTDNSNEDYLTNVYQFTKFQHTNQAIQNQSIVEIGVQTVVSSPRTDWHFQGFAIATIERKIEFEKINYFVDYQAVIHSFSGLCIIYPFHYFW